MDTLLFILTTTPLQLTGQLFNVNVPQIPRGDWQGGPIVRREHIPPIDTLKIERVAELYTCKTKINIIGQQSCAFHRGSVVRGCYYQYQLNERYPGSPRKRITCSEWKGTEA